MPMPRRVRHTPSIVETKLISTFKGVAIQNETDLSSYSGLLDIGSPLEGRYALVALFGRTALILGTITTVSIGGIAGTVLASMTIGAWMAFYLVDIGGLNGEQTVLITFSNGRSRCSAAVWRLKNLGSTSLFGSAVTSATLVDGVLTTPIDIPANGTGFSTANVTGVGGHLFTAGLTHQAEGFSAFGSSDFAAAQTALSVQSTKLTSTQDPMQLTIALSGGGSA